MTDNVFRLDELVGDQQPVSIQLGLTVLELPEIAKIPELLTRARQSIESGVSSFRAAAEYLADAQKLGVSQRQLADGVGKSGAWVNALLKWREHGCPEDTPFKNRRPLAKDHANADAFSDKTDTTFSSVRRENLIEALEFLGSARPGMRAKCALLVERRAPS